MSKTTVQITAVADREDVKARLIEMFVAECCYPGANLMDLAADAQQWYQEGVTTLDVWRAMFGEDEGDEQRFDAYARRVSEITGVDFATWIAEERTITPGQTFSWRTVVREAAQSADATPVLT